MNPATPLSTVLGALQRLAPESLAEPWDKPGLAVGDPDTLVSRGLLAIDFTDAVVHEAIAHRCELIVVYHPPIFQPVSMLVTAGPRSDWKQRALVGAVKASLAVYSPHTALDAAPGGLNDWLAAGLEESSVDALVGDEFSSVGAAESDGSMGRRRVLASPVDLPTLVARVKSRLGLSTVRVAAAVGPHSSRIHSVGVCAGSGGSALEQLPSCDAWVTGEMSHHGLLNAVQRGTHVVLTGHTHSERPYLPEYKRRLSQDSVAGQVLWRVSTADLPPWRYE